jgi:acyl transferase domain-containing protein
VVLALERGLIPPHLHFQALNPDISFEGTRFFVPTEARPWAGTESPRFAGVSSFGFGGTNAHVVLEEAPRLPQRPSVSPPSPAHLLPLSAGSPVALRDLARRYADALRPVDGEAKPFLADVCYSASTRRTHLDHRLALVADDVDSLAERLEAFAEAGTLQGAAVGHRPRSRSPRIAFVFSGQGPQWWAMGRQLAEQQRVFRESLARCDVEIRRHAGWSLLDELGADEGRSRLAQTEIAQPAIFSVQVALAALWKEWGIEPQALVGHSVGEIAAAHVAGALNLEDAARLVVARGRVMQKATGLGRMASVELAADDADRRLEGLRDRLAVAAINAPRSTVLSGDREALERLLAGLTAEGVPWRWLPVDYAFHSPQMKALGDELADLLRAWKVVTGATLVSTTTGREWAPTTWVPPTGEYPSG